MPDILIQDINKQTQDCFPKIGGTLDSHTDKADYFCPMLESLGQPRASVSLTLTKIPICLVFTSNSN